MSERARILYPLALLVAVSVLFALVWQSVGEQSDFAGSERDGIRYIQALVPLEIALTNAESAAVTGDSSPRDTLGRAIEAVAQVDAELSGSLRTQDRWTELRTKIESLPSTGAPAEIITAYGGANDLLLALMDKVRNTSKLIRDPEAGPYYLEDGAAQELPEGIVAAAQYTDLLVSVAKQSVADQAKSVVDISSAKSDLASNASDLSDDVRLAVEGSGGGELGAALLSKLDRFNRSIDNLKPLMAPLLAGKGGLDATKVVKARDETQAAAADLSVALLSQIDAALRDRLSSLSHKRLLAAGVLVVSVLVAAAPFVLAVLARRRKDPPAPAHQAPAPIPAPPPAPVPAYSAPSSEYAQWERFGASQ
ncbi:hypothetical protein [Actinoplanes subtropicus]|uniref:hypothetical protein n=1 Tax=Actinoplanes subtropicus TaxID=543632 RepID=UPI0014704EC0|nr:hypothetical protein [Actinoplanes subtropicus]